jgi:hypothetical protein
VSESMPASPHASLSHALPFESRALSNGRRRKSPTVSAGATAPRLVRRHPATPARHRRHPDPRRRRPCSPDHPGHWSFDGDRARAHTGHPRALPLRPIKGPLRAPSDSHHS